MSGNLIYREPESMPELLFRARDEYAVKYVFQSHDGSRVGAPIYLAVNSAGDIWVRDLDTLLYLTEWILRADLTFCLPFVVRRTVTEEVVL
jgi:hypothetical protein